MAINDYSATVLTEEQREQLLALSDDLPGLLERLDARKNVRDKENNLTEVLSEYFLKSYLSSIL
jgi:PII-like signaling protein